MSEGKDNYCCWQLCHNQDSLNILLRRHLLLSKGSLLDRWNKIGGFISAHSLMVTAHVVEDCTRKMFWLVCVCVLLRRPFVRDWLTLNRYMIPRLENFKHWGCWLLSSNIEMLWIIKWWMDIDWLCFVCTVASGRFTPADEAQCAGKRENWFARPGRYNKYWSKWARLPDNDSSSPLLTATSWLCV